MLLRTPCINMHESVSEMRLSSRKTLFDFMELNIHATPIYVSLYGPSNMCIFSSSVVLSSASITSSEKVNGYALTTIINAVGRDSRI